MMLRFIRTLGLAMLFLTSCSASTIVLDMTLSDFLFKRDVGAEIPGAFPVAVIIPDQAGGTKPMIVRHSDLKKVTDENPSYTFLIPDGKAAELNARLSSVPYGFESDTEQIELTGYVRIESTATDGQKLMVHGTWDDDRENVGWYTAADKAITPEAYKFRFGPGSIMQTALLAFVSNLVLFAVVRQLLKRRRDSYGPMKI